MSRDDSDTALLPPNANHKAPHYRWSRSDQLDSYLYIEIHLQLKDQDIKVPPDTSFFQRSLLSFLPCQSTTKHQPP